MGREEWANIAEALIVCYEAYEYLEITDEEEEKG